MDFDDAKENIQPLATGRSASLLHASLNLKSSEELLEQRRKFERAIRNYVGDDPLEPWYAYISWIEQSCPSGGKESGLDEVLTKCLTCFEQEERYYQDRRMIKLHIKYIDSHKDPTECYQQLFNAGIGTMVADFYISWAYWYDLSDNSRKADEIFQRGIACRAEPLDELIEAHQHFNFAVAQRFLYKDDDERKAVTNRQLQDRRLALISLRGGRRKAEVGSVRTGNAVKSHAPGTVKADASMASGSRSNVRLNVFTDENADLQRPTVTLPVSVGASGNVNDKTSPPVSEDSTSVVRSIIDAARHQENLKEPGPWNKARHDKKSAAKLFSNTKHSLGFNIHEDSGNVTSLKESISAKPLNPTIKSDNFIEKPFIFPTNFVTKNKPQKAWITPVTTDQTDGPKTIPQYKKYFLYPRKNMEFQPEELRSFQWFKRRGFSNEFTRKRDMVWAVNDPIAGIRQYPHFAKVSEPQIRDGLDVFYIPPKNHDLELNFDRIYDAEYKKELSLEELSLEQYKPNTTIIEENDMEETVCLPTELMQRRKSFFPNRKSIAPPCQTVVEASRHFSARPEPSDSLSNASATAESFVFPVAVAKISEPFEIYEDPTQTNYRAITDNDKQNTMKIVNCASRDFEFKTPALPSVKDGKLPFEIYEEPPPPLVSKKSDIVSVFDPEETCSTQTFNICIKSQSVSTPKASLKVTARTTGMVLRDLPVEEFTPLKVSEVEKRPGEISPISQIGEGGVDQAADGGNDGSEVLPGATYSPPEARQLSTILETSEQGTTQGTHTTGASTKSTFSSPDCGTEGPNGCHTVHSAIYRAIGPHTELEPLTESSHEHSVNSAVIEVGKLVGNIKIQGDCKSVMDENRANEQRNAAVTPAAIRQQPVTESRFEIFEDHTNSGNKQTGNFTRLEQREDTNPGFSVRSIHFQDDRTETMSRVLLTSKRNTFIQEDRTDTVPKMLPATSMGIIFEDDRPEILPKFPQPAVFKTPAIDPMGSSDDIDDEMMKSPGSLIRPTTTTTTTITTTANNVYAINTTNAKEQFSFFDILSTTRQQNESKHIIDLSDTLDPLPNLSLMPTRQTDKSLVAKLKNKSIFESSFLPNFSFKADSQPLSQAAFNHGGVDSLGDVGGEKAKLAVSILPDFSFVADSQPQQGAVNPRATTSSQQHLLMASFMKDFSAVGSEALNSDNGNQSFLMQFSKNKSSLKFQNDSIADNAFSQKGKIIEDMPSPAKGSFLEPKTSEMKAISKGSSNPEEKRLSVSQFFKLNAEMETFGPNVSGIRNSTRLTNYGPPKLSGVASEAQMIENKVTEPSSLPPPVLEEERKAETSLSVVGQVADNSRTDRDDSNGIELSMYYRHPPKMPMKRHSEDWEEVNDCHTPTANPYVHAEVDLNQTNEVIENFLIDPNLNPFDERLTAALLEAIDFSNYIEELPTCQLVGHLPRLQANSSIRVHDIEFHVAKAIGKGAYGVVFRGKIANGDKNYVLKQERPPNLWEYYICLEVESRLQNDNMLAAFMQVEYALIANNASILISEFSPYGSLTEVCNRVKKQTMKNVDEFIVMHLACELLEVVDHLHGIHIIHADLKPDNVLLVNLLKYPNECRILQIIDFGVSIDMRRFEGGQTFKYVHSNDSFNCVEMREGRPWTYQLDLFGMAGIIHVLLFGKYMEIEKRPNGSWMHKTHMPRYFNRTLWETIFKTLLNVPNCQSMPNLQQLRMLLKEELAEKESYLLRKIADFNRALMQP